MTQYVLLYNWSWRPLFIGLKLQGYPHSEHVLSLWKILLTYKIMQGRVHVKCIFLHRVLLASEYQSWNSNWNIFFKNYLILGGTPRFSSKKTPNIPGVGTALRITCKDKGSVLHQRLKACSVEECYRYIWCLTVFDSHIQAFRKKSP